MERKETTSYSLQTYNWFSEQVCFLIGILNLVAELEIQKPRKVSWKYLSFIKVTTVKLGNKIYDVKTSVDNRILELIERDKQQDVDEGKINRRMKIYKMKEMIHVLMDIVNETRFKLKTEENGNNISIDKRVIQSAVIDGIFYSKSEIRIIGHKLHEILMNMFLSNFRHQGKVTIKKGDTEIMSILLQGE